MKTIFEETETRIPAHSSNGRTHATTNRGRSTNSRVRSKPSKPKTPPRRSPSLLTRWTQRMAYFTAFRDYAADYIADYMADQAELVRRRSREAVQFATSRLICGALVLAVALMAVVLTLQGISGALAEAFGGRAWAGNLTTAGILAVAAFGAWLYMKLSARDDRSEDRRHARRRR
jgi:hypothetical protein